MNVFYCDYVLSINILTFLVVLIELVDGLSGLSPPFT